MKSTFTRKHLLMLLVAMAAVGVAGVGLAHSESLWSLSKPSTSPEVVLAAAPAPSSSAANLTPVVVELFTSEGCSSCPPADALLIELDQKQPIAGAEVIALGQHVDYWDRLGWKDRFSSAQYTDRQREYATKFNLDGSYTPQMVVDGQKEFVGSSKSAAYAAVQHAAQSPKPAAVTLTRNSGDQITIHVNEPGAHGQPTVYLAVTESGIETHVGSGENGGRHLHHSAVVHTLKALGTMRDGQFQGTETIALSKDWSRAQVKAVVFVQNDSGPILGAAALGMN